MSLKGRKLVVSSVNKLIGDNLGQYLHYLLPKEARWRKISENHSWKCHFVMSNASDPHQKETTLRSNPNKFKKKIPKFILNLFSSFFSRS